MAEYHNQSKLRFWCQMVLPLVYDDSLSYMELLNKVVDYLNNCIQDVGNCETNIESLLEAFVNLQNYVNEIADDVDDIVEEKIDEMIESGEFGEIVTDALAIVIASEYDPSESYTPLDYVIYEGTLYCCTNNTTGTWDSTKWRETTVGDELNTLMLKVYNLKASEVENDSNVSGTTVKDALNNLPTNQDISNLNTAINGKMDANPAKIELIPPSNAGHGGFIDFHYNGSTADYTSRIIEHPTGNISISGSLSLGTPLPVTSGGTGNTSVDTTPTQNSTKMVTSGGVYSAINDLKAENFIQITVHSGTDARELGRASLLLYGSLFIFHGFLIVDSLLTTGTILYDLPEHTYKLPSLTNNVTYMVNGADWTTIGINSGSHAISVTYGSGMPAGRYEILLVGTIE